jgi:hypothetical protein
MALRFDIRDGHPSPSVYERDHEVMDLIIDCAPMLSLNKIMALGVAEFGPARFPSRSQLHRIIVKVRGWAGP